MNWKWSSDQIKDVQLALVYLLSLDQDIYKLYQILPFPSQAMRHTQILRAVNSSKVFSWDFPSLQVFEHKLDVKVWYSIVLEVRVDDL